MVNKGKLGLLAILHRIVYAYDMSMCKLDILEIHNFPFIGST